MGNTVVLTIYTDGFDSMENIANGGMSGKAFLDVDNLVGIQFKSADEALSYCSRNSIEIDRLDFNYIDGSGSQMFMKFNIAN